MSTDARITSKQLHEAMQDEIRTLVEEVTGAVNDAPGGSVISGSEEAVRDAMGRFRQQVYERAIQLRTEAAQAAFPPRNHATNKGWRHKGEQAVSHLTANGTIRIRRTIWWCKEGGTDSRLEAWLGIDEDRVTVGARELCCRATVTGPSFAKSAANLERLGQIRVSAERLRQIVEGEGQRALQARDKGVVGPTWEARDCQVTPEGPTRVMVGSDGVMVPVITAAEKQKRREDRRSSGGKRRQRSKTVARRGKRGRGKRRRCRGSDNGYKEFKIVTFYDQGHERQYAAGTAGDHEALGRLMRREARKVKLDQADEKLSVSDGAGWIRKQMQTRLPMLDAMILDYYHLAEHVATAARLCFGEGSERALAWRKEVLGAVWQEGPAAMLVRIAETRRSVRSPTKREPLRKLEQYVAKRCEMLDYPTFRARGFDLGSGPTEAFCKTLTARLKGSGMRWDLPNAEGMMALTAMDQSGVWDTYWSLQRALAA